MKKEEMKGSDKFQKELKTTIDKEKNKIPGEIKEREIFSTWFNSNCEIVINKVQLYAVRLIIYEQSVSKKRNEILFIKKFPSPNLLSGYQRLEEAKRKAQEIKQKLNSNNPVLAIVEGNNFSLNDAIKKIHLSLDNIDLGKPEENLKKFDIIWRKSPIIGYHTAIYLGKGQFAHIYFNSANSLRDLQAKKDSWEVFLKKTEENRLIINRVIIPFKKPELIEEHINIAVEKGYGSGKYNFLTKNCEHFATLCVCGIPFSNQVNNLFWKRKIKLKKDEILKKIEKTNEYFANLEKGNSEFNDNDDSISNFSFTTGESESFKEELGKKQEEINQLTKENEKLKKLLFSQLENKEKELEELKTIDKESSIESSLSLKKFVKEREKDIIEFKKLLKPLLFLGSKKDVKSDSQQENEEILQCFFALLDLNSQDKDFINWLKTEKSKDLENFTDPQWVKNNTDISKLRNEYEEYEQGQRQTLIQIDPK